MINKWYYIWRPVTSVALQGSTIGSVHELYQSPEGGTVTDFVDDTKLTGQEGEPASLLKGKATVQRDVGSLIWTSRNFPKSHKDTYKVPHLQQENPCNNTGWALFGWRAALLNKTWRSWQTAS